MYLAHGVSWISCAMTTPRLASSATVDSRLLARRIMPFIDGSQRLIFRDQSDRCLAASRTHLEPAQRLPPGELISLVGQQIPAETVDVEFPGLILAADRHRSAV